MGYIFLSAAIISEVIASLSLKASDGFSKPAYAALMVVGYISAFTFLTLALGRDLPLGVAYGIWAAAGVAAVAILSVPIFNETLSLMQGAGIALVIAGVAALELGAAH